jgi:hemin uptake protein HemP
MRIILIRMSYFLPSTLSASQSSPPASDGGLRERREVTSEILLAGSKELVIKHAGRDYHLRLTKLGKLILTA